MPEEKTSDGSTKRTRSPRSKWDLAYDLWTTLPPNPWVRYGILMVMVILAAITLLLYRGVLPTHWSSRPTVSELSAASNPPETPSLRGHPSSVTPLVTHSTEDLKVAVLYPDPSVNGAPYEDGKVQLQGFLSASDEYPAAKLVPYRFPTENNNLPLSEELMPKFHDLYKDGYRIFILTMSGANLGIKNDFKKWVAQYKGEDDSPILIATVASAPGIADAEAGIFRYYVRSQEEASELARYAAWKDGLEKVGMFYVDDPYGEGGRNTFDHEFRVDFGRETEAYDVQKSGINAREKVREFMTQIHAARAGAFVVGYDAMLRETVEELIKSGFNGPILCSSTLTAPTWQPRVPTNGREIVTVVPHRDGPHAQAEENVVFVFSRITLNRALRCASQSRTTREFALRWQRQGDNEGGIEAHHLVDGDAIIPMTVTSQWRAKDIR